jgi:protein-disulfide isomerase
VAGNPKGDVTVVEFFDYRCTFCKRVLPAVRRLLRDDPRIRYVFKEFPILTPQSRIAARAALAAWRVAPETYFGFHVDLMSARGALGEAVILRLAANAGLDTQRLKREMQSPEIEAVLRRNAEIAQRLGIQGTPAFIIGERLVPGAIDLAQLQSLVAEARGR